jgi:3-methyladenine DNA glycosylase AlkD
MNNLEDILTDIFEQHADTKKAVEMSQYMRNLHPYYGISKPLRADITKPLIQELKSSAPDMKLIHALWNKPQREYQYFCLNYLIATQKHWQEDIIRDFEQLIISKSWWDSVDTLAVRLVGEYFKKWTKNLKKIINRWTESDNIWLNRTAIIFQLKYKDKIDEKLLYDIIRKHVHSNEFFIQKAIGWALREYAYTEPESVMIFINSTQLKPLSKREAIKKMK